MLLDAVSVETMTENASHYSHCQSSNYIRGSQPGVLVPQGVRDWTSRGMKILGSQSSLYISY